MKTINLFILCTAIFLQFSHIGFSQTTTDTESTLVPNTNVVSPPVSTSKNLSQSQGHLITFTADYSARAISIFYPDRTELIYVKIRRGRWINPANTYSLMDYEVVYEDGTRKNFENVKLFRRQDIMQRVVTDHLSKLTELGYELVETNMTDFDDDKFLTAIFRFKG